jgi:hypothetical protein
MVLSKKILIGFFVLLFGVLLLNTFHEEYPDEYDSLVGGRYIDSGKLIYKQWFQHHQPGAYVLAAFIYPFSGQSFVRFRILLAFFWLGFHIFTFRYLRRRMSGELSTLYLLYLFVISIAGTYYWGQMLLADTLSAILIAPAVALLLSKILSKSEFTKNDLKFVGFLSFFTWFTSMTYIFVVALTTLSGIILYFKFEKKLSFKNKIITSGKIILLPYILFFIYLLVTWSIKDWYFASVEYNQRFYIYNYPRPEGAAVNPIRYAIAIVNDFLNNYIPALTGIKSIDFTSPIIPVLALGTFGMTLVLVLNGNIFLALLYFGMIIFANARSNPMAVRETDYQSSVYLSLGLLSSTFLIGYCIEKINHIKALLSEKIVYGFLFGLTSLFLLFSALHFGNKMLNKYYPKYMGTMPLIYDRPEIAQTINKFVRPNEYAWIGPFQFKELFYLNTKIPSKYHWFLQHAAHSKIKDEMVADLAKNPPLVVVFDRQYAPWGGNAAEFNYFITDILDRDYIRLYKLNDTNPDFNYKWTEEKTQNFILDRDINLRKDKLDELLKRLLEKNLIKKQTKDT